MRPDGISRQSAIHVASPSFMTMDYSLLLYSLWVPVVLSVEGKWKRSLLRGYSCFRAHLSAVLFVEAVGSVIMHANRSVVETWRLENFNVFMLRYVDDKSGGGAVECAIVILHSIHSRRIKFDAKENDRRSFRCSVRAYSACTNDCAVALFMKYQSSAFIPELRFYCYNHFLNI